MSKVCAVLIIIAVLSIPILLVILLVKALMRKPIKIVAIVLAACTFSIAPLTLLGVATDPSTPQRFVDELNSLTHNENATQRNGDTEKVNEEVVETQENEGDTVDTLSSSEYIEETHEEPTGKCEPGKKFSFQFEGSTAASYIKPFCEHNGHVYISTIFRGTPDDLSYLDVVAEHSDGDEIVWGEYYTVTAVMTLGDYDFGRTRIRCQVESGNIIVNFSVEFRDGFEESVDLLNEGDTVTFRGRFYDEGCGFTDCELIRE